MSSEAQQHLKQLDLEFGCGLDEVRQAYRTLSFIWHPDRQPEQYNELAQAKIQRLNDAHAYFSAHPEELVHDDVDVLAEQQHPDATSSYKAHTASCVRCQGSGLVASEVTSMGKFEHEDCSVCLGSGKMVVDERNLCKCCMGEGLNPDLSPEDREAWIDVEFQKRGWFDRHLNPNEYKRLWLRYHREHMVCSSCEGAGYFFFRPDSRKEERRLSSPADFLRDLNDTEEGRREDRRKVL